MISETTISIQSTNLINYLVKKIMDGFDCEKIGEKK